MACCCGSPPDNTATRIAGGTRRRSSSAPPRNGSSAWTAARAARPRAGARSRNCVLPRTGARRASGHGRGPPDWCVSRQRYWGVPITLFTHKQTGELHPRTAELMEQVAQRIEQGGIDAWFELDPSGAAGRGRGELRQGPRHPGRLVRFRHHPRRCWIAARNCISPRNCIWKAPTSIAAGSSRRC
jgi:hypothetical protein